MQEADGRHGGLPQDQGVQLPAARRVHARPGEVSKIVNLSYLDGALGLSEDSIGFECVGRC